MGNPLKKLGKVAPLIGGAAGLALGGPIGGLLGASIGGSISQYGAASDAAKDQMKAINKASQIKQEMFNKGLEVTAPWRQAGEEALSLYKGAYGIGTPEDRLAAQSAYQESPGYAFQLGEAEKAARRQLAASGLSSSGAEFKELMRISQGMAAQDYGNYLEGLRYLSEGGRAAAGQAFGGYQDQGTRLSQDAYAIGEAKAAEGIQKSNILTDLAGTGAMLYGLKSGGFFDSPSSATSNGVSPYGLPSSSLQYDSMGYMPESGYLSIA